MPNAWFLYLFPLALAVIFIIGGASIFRMARRGQVGTPGRPGRKPFAQAGCLASPFILIGCVVGVSLLVNSPTPCQRRERFDRIFHTPPEQIVAVTLRPAGDHPYKPLVREPVTIRDRATLEQIAGVLARATEWSPNHPSSNWTTAVELVTTQGRYIFEVDATPPDANGTLVYVHSGGTDGWNLGEFRADGLEKLLEAAARAPTTQPAVPAVP